MISSPSNSLHASVITTCTSLLPMAPPRHSAPGTGKRKTDWFHPVVATRKAVLAALHSRVPNQGGGCKGHGNQRDRATGGSAAVVWPGGAWPMQGRVRAWLPCRPPTLQ